MTQILWQVPTQVIDAIGFFSVRSQNQAPIFRGLLIRFFEVLPKGLERILVGEQLPVRDGLRFAQNRAQGAAPTAQDAAPRFRQHNPSLRTMGVEPAAQIDTTTACLSLRT